VREWANPPQNGRRADARHGAFFRQAIQGLAGQGDGPAHVTAHGSVRGAVGHDQPREVDGVGMRRMALQPPLERLQHALRGLPLPGHIERSRGQKLHPGPGAHDIVRQGVQPTHERGHVDAGPGGSLLHGPFDRVTGQVRVVRRQGVMDGFGDKVVTIVPQRSTAVQLGDLFGSCCSLPGLQELAKETVVAIPAALAVQRHQEQVGPLQGFQDGLAWGNGG